jgi:HAD superfamily hydrolase (TIGR01490 family)
MSRGGVHAVLFDMDKTLVRKDTSFLFTRYRWAIGDASALEMLRVTWWLLRYKLGLFDARRVAKLALKAFEGREERWLVEAYQDWYGRYAREHVAARGREAVARHLAAGDWVAVVTATARYAARPLAEELRIDHIVCTRLEVDARGRLTGEVIEPICYGEGKIELLRRSEAVHGFDLRQATFFSDSITDLPLLEYVGTPIVVNPDARLRRVATKRGWPIESW